MLQSQKMKCTRGTPIETLLKIQLARNIYRNLSLHNNYVKINPVQAKEDF